MFFEMTMMQPEKWGQGHRRLDMNFVPKFKA